MSFEVVCCLALKDSQTVHHLRPLAAHPLVSRLWIVRSHISRYGAIPNSEYRLTPSAFKPIRWLQMRIACERLARRPEVRAFVSFNPFPYGVLAASAARRHQKAMHYGFIGTDWYRYMQGPLGNWLMRRIRRGEFFTATGDEMREDMIRRGLDGDRIAILPHSVDLEHYPVLPPDDKPYAGIFVGKLISLKRVDVLLQAFAKVLNRRPEERLCIVGGGPLLKSLQALAQSLNIAHAVDFTGPVEDVSPHLAKARMIIISSNQEGFPFALVEGICSGLVPLATPVGTIPNHIQNGFHGYLVPVGDAQALADKLLRLMEEPKLYAEIRENALQLRSQFAYDRATSIWDCWLQRLETSSK